MNSMDNLEKRIALESVGLYYLANASTENGGGP